MNTQYCHNCKAPTAHTENDTSHFLHLILTLFTGVWALIWAYCFFSNGQKADKCLQCGCKN